MGRKVTIDVTEAGRQGGKARAANLSAKELSEAARSAVKARWEQYYRDHPDRLKARKERDVRKAGKIGQRRKAKKGTKRK